MMPGLCLSVHLLAKFSRFLRLPLVAMCMPKDQRALSRLWQQPNDCSSYSFCQLLVVAPSTSIMLFSMQTPWRAFAFSVSIGIPSIRLICNTLVRSCKLFIPILRARDHCLASSSKTASKAGLLLFYLTALPRLDPAFRQLVMCLQSLRWPSSG